MEGTTKTVRSRSGAWASGARVKVIVTAMAVVTLVPGCGMFGRKPFCPYPETAANDASAAGRVGSNSSAPPVIETAVGPDCAVEPTGVQYPVLPAAAKSEPRTWVSEPITIHDPYGPGKPELNSIARNELEKALRLRDPAVPLRVRTHSEFGGHPWKKGQHEELMQSRVETVKRFLAQHGFTVSQASGTFGRKRNGERWLVIESDPGSR